MAPRIQLARIFPVCREILGSTRWRRTVAAHPAGESPEHFPNTLESLAAAGKLQPYLPDLARLEWTFHQVAAAAAPSLPQAGPGILNPTLELVPCGWRNLPQLLAGERQRRSDQPGGRTGGRLAGHERPGPPGGCHARRSGGPESDRGGRFPGGRGQGLRGSPGPHRSGAPAGDPAGPYSGSALGHPSGSGSICPRSKSAGGVQHRPGVQPAVAFDPGLRPSLPPLL